MKMEDLKQKAEELQVCIRLEQHHRVSELANQISRELVGLFDEELDQQSESCEPAEGKLRSKLGEELSLIQKLCQGLRKLSQMTAIYHDVVEFVRVQDLIAHGKLVAAFEFNPEQSGESIHETFDPDELLKVLRQSMIILRDINSSFDKYHLARESSSSMMQYKFVHKSKAGFTRYELDLQELRPKIEYQSAAVDDKSLILDLKGLANHRDGELGNLNGILSSEWFVEFVEFTLERKYPFDKFTVLVALLIVGIECNHTTLQQLISSLIDQVFHQETTSGNLEEVLQLKQVGSFWLSHRRRFSSAFVHQVPTSATRLDYIDDIDDYDSDSDEMDKNFEDQVESSLSDDIERSADDEINQTKSSSNQRQEKEIELRKIIDQEILTGESCRLCGSQLDVNSLDPLEGVACTTCQSSRLLEYCSVSHKTVELLPLLDLVNFFPNLEKIILVKPNEWMSNWLIVANEMKVFPWLKASKNREGGNEAEHFDTSENYERLTVIRNRLPVEGAEQSTGLIASRNYGSNSSSSLDTDDDELPGQKLVADSATVGDHDGECGNTILNFMRKRLKVARYSAQSSSTRKCSSGASANADSESFQLIKFVDRHSTTVLPVCSADLLVSDSLGKLLNVALILNSSSNLQAVPSSHYLGAVNVDLILACRRRSATSGLMIGCNRLYDSSEIIHHHGEPMMEMNSFCQTSVTCPNCKDESCQLIELRPGLSRPVCFD